MLLFQFTNRVAPTIFKSKFKQTFRFSTSFLADTQKKETSNSGVSIKQRLLETSIQYVPKYGWNQKPIHVACSMLDLSPASHKLIKPFDMVSYMMKKWSAESLRHLDDTMFEGKKRIPQKVSLAIKNRLQREAPFLDTWGQAMKLGAHPENFLQTKNILWEYSDQVWFRCGDRATDYNHYTKRTLFNMAYASTELFMLTDKSEGYRETWTFLERRLEDISKVGKQVGNLKTVLSHAGNGIGTLFTMFSNSNSFDRPIAEEKADTSTVNSPNQHKKEIKQPNTNKPQENVKIQTNQSQSSTSPINNIEKQKK